MTASRAERARNRKASPDVWNGTWPSISPASGHASASGLYHRILREIEGPLIGAALAATRGNQIRAAELLGVNRNTLRKKVRDLELSVVRSSR